MPGGVWYLSNHLWYIHCGTPVYSEILRIEVAFSIKVSACERVGVCQGPVRPFRGGVSIILEGTVSCYPCRSGAKVSGSFFDQLRA